jgi:NADH:ubiquinone oxidoreductase subunit F (NADH-binding)
LFLKLPEAGHKAIANADEMEPGAESRFLRRKSPSTIAGMIIASYATGAKAYIFYDGLIKLKQYSARRSKAYKADILCDILGSGYVSTYISIAVQDDIFAVKNRTISLWREKRHSTI